MKDKGFILICKEAFFQFRPRSILNKFLLYANYKIVFFPYINIIKKSTKQDIEKSLFTKLDIVISFHLKKSLLKSVQWLFL